MSSFTVTTLIVKIRRSFIYKKNMVLSELSVNKCFIFIFWKQDV